MYSGTVSDTLLAGCRPPRQRRAAALLCEERSLLALVDEYSKCSSQTAREEYQVPVQVPGEQQRKDTRCEAASDMMFCTVLLVQDNHKYRYWYAYLYGMKNPFSNLLSSYLHVSSTCYVYRNLLSEYSTSTILHNPQQKKAGFVLSKSIICHIFVARLPHLPHFCGSHCHKNVAA